MSAAAYRFRNDQIGVPKPKGHGTIYYIVCPDTFRVKIGFTMGSPEARLRALRTGSPTEIMLLAIHHGTLDDERRLHERFHELRLHGEWFKAEDDLIEHCVLICWLEAAFASRCGTKAPHWACMGLQSYENDGEALPDYIKAAM